MQLRAMSVLVLEYIFLKAKKLFLLNYLGIVLLILDVVFCCCNPPALKILLLVHFGFKVIVSSLSSHTSLVVSSLMFSHQQGRTVVNWAYFVLFF